MQRANRRPWPHLSKLAAHFPPFHAGAHSTSVLRGVGSGWGASHGSDNSVSQEGLESGSCHQTPGPGVIFQKPLPEPSLRLTSFLGLPSSTHDAFPLAAESLRPSGRRPRIPTPALRGSCLHPPGELCHRTQNIPKPPKKATWWQKDPLPIPEGPSTLQGGTKRPLFTPQKPSSGGACTWDTLKVHLRPSSPETFRLSSTTLWALGPGHGVKTLGANEPRLSDWKVGLSILINPSLWIGNQTTGGAPTP